MYQISPGAIKYIEKMEKPQRISLKTKKNNFASVENNVVSMETQVVNKRRSRSLSLLRSEQNLPLQKNDIFKHTVFKTSAEIIKDAEKSLLARNSQGEY